MGKRLRSKKHPRQPKKRENSTFDIFEGTISREELCRVLRRSARTILRYENEEGLPYIEHGKSHRYFIASVTEWWAGREKRKPKPTKPKPRNPRQPPM